MKSQLSNAESADPAYKNLYLLGGAAAFIAIVLILIEVIGFAVCPQPGTVKDWFALFQSNPIGGLLEFWLLEIPLYGMFALVFIAFYSALGKISPGAMAVALTLALLGVGIFLATNNPFSMLSLSRQYAGAPTDAQRSEFLAAGQTVLAHTGQRAAGGFNLGIFLVSVAGLIVSAVMLRSALFSRLTACAGILANTLSLADFLRQAVTSSSILLLLVVLPYTLFLLIWYGLVAQRFFRLGRLNHGMNPSKLK